MAERYFFFDSTVDDEREYTATMYADYFDTLVESGVFADRLNSLQVTCSGSNMSSLLDTGRAFVKGHFYENDSTLSLTHSKSDLVNDRIDLIVLRLDRNIANRNIKAMILEGAPNASPVEPAVIRNDEIYDVKLAKVKVRGGQSAIQSTDITDAREYARYRTKPAWYPDGEVPLDAWMYTVFKNQLTDQEITDIEVNQSLMDMINKSSLPKKQDLSEIITDGIVANALNELKITETDTPSKAVKIDTGKVNLDVTVYTYDTPTILAIDPSDALDVSSEAKVTDISMQITTTYFPIANQSGDGLATTTDVTVTRVSDGSSVNVTGIDALTGLITTDAVDGTAVHVTYKSFSKRIDVIYVDSDGTLSVLKGTPTLPLFDPNVPSLADGVFGLAEVNLGANYSTIIDSDITEYRIFTGLNYILKQLSLKANQVDINLLKSNVDNLIYDVYSSWLEQYYLGNLTNSPDPHNAKTIMFDGFLDENNIDTINTTADINTTDNYIKTLSPVDVSNLVPTSIVCPWYTEANLRDSNMSTKFTQYLGTNSNITLGEVQLNFDSVHLINKINVYASSSQQWCSIDLRNIKYSLDGVTWKDAGDVSSSGLADNDTPQLEAFILPEIIKAKHIKFQIYLNNGAGSYSANIWIADLGISTLQVYSSEMVSKIKEIPFTCNKVKLYISDDTIENNQIDYYISFDGGTNFILGNEVGVRQDSKFTDYNEKEIEFSGNGTQIQLKAILNPNDNQDIHKIKRYGLFCYE